MKKLEKQISTELVRPDLLQITLQETLKKINQGLKEVGVVENAKFLTTGQFKFEEFNQNQTNIHTCQDVNQLIKGLAVLRNLKREFNIVAEENGVKGAELIWVGYPYSSWENDFNIRIKLVANAVRIKKLQESKLELEAFLSADKRLELTLEKVQSIFI